MYRHFRTLFFKEFFKEVVRVRLYAASRQSQELLQLVLFSFSPVSTVLHFVFSWALSIYFPSIRCASPVIHYGSRLHVSLVYCFFVSALFYLRLVFTASLYHRRFHRIGMRVCTLLEFSSNSDKMWLTCHPILEGFPRYSFRLDPFHFCTIELDAYCFGPVLLFGKSGSLQTRWYWLPSHCF